MDAELRVRYRALDTVVVGDRVRAARVRAGVTQRDAAGDDVSAAYVSRIESGARRAGLDLLAQIAARLDTTLEELLAPDTDASADFDRVARLRLELEYAELALLTGDAATALAGAAGVVADLDAPGELRREARRVRALALESAGDMNAAVRAFEDLLPHETNAARLIEVLIALCRCYRDLGELDQAVDVGRRAEERLGAAALHGTTEGIQLALTLASSYYESGATHHAVRICARAMEAAEALDSPVAQASAYWNSSIMESEAGRVHSAIPLARKALALLSPSSDARNIARLRTLMGQLLLREDPPDLTEAMKHLDRARRELEVSSAGPVDVSLNLLSVAQALFLGDDLSAARTSAARATDLVGDTAPLIAAEAAVILGQIEAREGRTDLAVEEFQRAALLLTGIGADRSTATVWLELADLLESVDQVDGALRAYRAATAAAGLTARPRARRRVPSSPVAPARGTP